MKAKRLHAQHGGEIYVQKKMHSPSGLPDQIAQFIQTEMPAQHTEFYGGLSYIPLGTLDKSGRPWVSMLVTESNVEPSIGIHVTSEHKLKLTTRLNSADPFHRAVAETKMTTPELNPLFAGVGIDFSNRRRNKLAGVIESAEEQHSGLLSLTLNSDEHLGNCPKYITVRELVPKTRSPETQLNQFESIDSPLPDFCKEHINRVSTVFLATKHTTKDESNTDDHTDMGLNHRGGAPGFVRLYEEADNSAPLGSPENDTQHPVTTYLILPDFSGNRFYQSLGNIQNDKFVGLALPDFKTGDVLYVTGEAENLFDSDAQQVMPRVSLVTRIKLTGAVFIKQALDLELVSEEQLSPYNPPIRYLTQELEELGHTRDAVKGDAGITATLSGVSALTPNVSTFSFSLSKPIQSPLPGGFCVISFSDLLGTGYSHMNEANPQLVNEDYLRTWTISSAPKYNMEKGQFDPVDNLDVTVKLKPDGLISPFLHGKGALGSQVNRENMDVTLNGVGGNFTCFRHDDDGVFHIPSSMVWVAGGVGITPFMSMWSGVLALAEHTKALSTDILLMFAGRSHDLELVKHFLENNLNPDSSISITVKAYLTKESDPKRLHKEVDLLSHPLLTVNDRRMEADDFGAIKNLVEQDVFICGPEGLTGTVKDWLKQQKVDPLKIHEESFFF